ncbi:30S ribosomal protein S12 methylthiotransferase RimO [Enterorhabdus sp. P55]|uniref:30S ribosomal protein S12 methylthiotransferase RimO n=1 Tax=Enterorhabdus sp. P55 TaxID=2304571 RepID=UPI0013717861|nr:30S ribosomal protein S12 methylthiotransferase RimO [Enterorhabdus sp. P55]NBI32036.1 30S ribosomal protein S12 methylthiotransferase RimO [Enterorhabdus sp. P55]
MEATSHQGAEAGRAEAPARPVCFITLGCAKNEADTAAMERRAVAAGYRLEDDPERADAIVVNTCSFIQSATEESIEAVLDAAGLPRVAAGGTRLVVAGCMPARYGDELAAELPEAAAFVPCSREDDIVAVLDGLFGVERAVGEPLAGEGAAARPAGAFGYVKISDGCDRWCSYCAIPLIRGRYRSFPFEQVRADVARLVDAGVREVDLIAQDTGRWGADFDEPRDLAWLVDALACEFPDTWLRVMYLQPEGVTDELLAVMGRHANVCSYLDIPLQHVCEPVLRAMNRRGSRASFEALVGRIRAALPDVTLRTTLIAGFPGEDDEQFEELLDFVAEGLFDYVGVFAYSREEGTAAFDLPGQVDEDEKAERAQRLRDAADAASAPLIAARVGRVAEVLVEGAEEDGQLFGRAQCQAPDVDGVTYLDAGEPGQVVAARIVDTLLYEMEGEVLES